MEKNIISKVFFEKPELYKQFEPLAEYFGTITPDQLVNEDIYDFPSMTPMEHRILMSVFVHKYLGPFL